MQLQNQHKHYLKMKKNILLTSLLLITLLCFSQHIIILKTGEKLNGKVIGGKKDSIHFNFLGNKMRFSHADIKTIYFSPEALEEQTAAPEPEVIVPAKVNKPAKARKVEVIVEDPNASNETETVAANIPTAEAAATNNAPAVAPQTASKLAKIGGTINYYLTKENISKADSGARVLIVDSAKVPAFKIAVVDTFHFGNAYREIYQQYKLSHTKVPDDIPEQLAMWKANDKNSFDLLARRVYKNTNMLKNAPEAESAIADFRGQFSIPVKPGTYYVYIVSNNAVGQTMVDLEGKVYCRKVTVKGDQDELFKVSFDVF